jgi:hypothetical protein
MTPYAKEAQAAAALWAPAPSPASTQAPAFDMLTLTPFNTRADFN